MLARWCALRVDNLACRCPLISYVNCKHSRICQHSLACGLLFSDSPFILDPHTLKNVRNAKSVAIASPGPSLCSWAGAVLGCPCQCLPLFLLLWKLDSLEQHLQAFAGRGEKRKSPECLAAPLQRCPVLQCHGSEDMRLNFIMEKRFVHPAKPDVLGARYLHLSENMFHPRCDLSSICGNRLSQSMLKTSDL